MNPTHAYTLIAQALNINPSTFQEGLSKGRKPVKLACALGASYDAAEIVAPLKLATTADEINTAYSRGSQSCMAGHPVGAYYAALGVSCLYSDNFRALVLQDPETGNLITPRCYGVHCSAVPKFLGDLLVVSADAFSGILPKDEYVQETLENNTIQEGVYRYTLTPQVYSHAVGWDNAAFILANPAPERWTPLWHEARAKAEACLKAQAIADFKNPQPFQLEGTRDSRDLRDTLTYLKSTVVMTAEGQPVTYFLKFKITKTVTVKTTIIQKIVRAVLISETRDPRQKGMFIPYRDFHCAYSETPLTGLRPAATENLSGWDKVADAIEAEYNGYRY